MLSMFILCTNILNKEIDESIFIEIGNCILENLINIYF